MLQMLGCTRVVLLTNNPAKLDGLAKAGIEIAGRMPIETPINSDNRRYLTAKASRAGHHLRHVIAALTETPEGDAGGEAGALSCRPGWRERGMPESATPAYTLTARVLHWVTAALVLTMIPIGVAMANADFGAWQDTLYHLHRSMGAVLLPLVLGRLIWRLTHPAPPLPADIPAIQQFAAHATHWALYALLIAQAMVGWIATSAYRAPILVFWLFELPPIWREDKAFSEMMFTVHRTIGIAIALLLCAHIGAALYHHFIRKDSVLMRMVSG